MANREEQAIVRAALAWWRGGCAMRTEFAGRDLDIALAVACLAYEDPTLTKRQLERLRAACLAQFAEWGRAKGARKP
jgi:hypothetical protein